MHSDQLPFNQMAAVWGWQSCAQHSPEPPGALPGGGVDVFPVQTVVTVGPALLALGLGVSFVFLPNRDRCSLIRVLITVDQLDRKLVVFSNSEL
jgi:hypothetical protein